MCIRDRFTTVAVTIDWATVDDAGNVADHDTGLGAVPYDYRIGKFEITATQYAEFLNAVAKEDTNHLYSELEDANWLARTIDRFGEPGNYVYRPVADATNWPVNYTNFWEAARFANWMHNGQPVGLQDENTTEDGAYTLTPESIANNSVTRNPNARFFLPSEDEWYKAAYYKGGSLDAGYWNYPTQHDHEPLRTEPSGEPNSANYGGAVSVLRFGLVGGPAPTDVGSYHNTVGPYGTFDQAGNVWETTETVDEAYPDARLVKGGSFFIQFRDNLHRVDTTFGLVGDALSTRGFRMASLHLPCDFDGDFFCTVSDLDLLMDEADSVDADLDGNGLVNDADRDRWLSLAALENGHSEAYLVGDANLDGVVDSRDLNEVGIYWLDTNARKWSEGNFTLEGKPGVNGLDLNELGVNWHQSNLNQEARTVPEPGNFYWGLLLIPLVLRRFR